LKELNLIIPNHPHSRKYNSLGGCEDIKTHRWIHCNVKFIAKPVDYDPIKKAFSTLNPFTILGWRIDDDPTITISRWTVRDSPVADQEGDSLWLSFEVQEKTPDSFLNFLSNKFNMKIRLTYYQPYMIRFKQKYFLPASGKIF
jgi:hypothetical protein